MDAIVKYKESRDSLFRYSGISPESKYAATKGPVRNTHYLEMGKGEPFILIHGGLSHSCEWFPLLKPLSDHFHLYVIDRPGHGLTDTIDYNGMDFRQSAVEFLHSFMQSIGLERAHIMGNSIGGFFAISFALMHPEKVENLVLIGAPAGLNRWIHPMLRLMGTKGINRLLAQTIAKPGISGFKMLHKKLLVVDTNRLPAVYFENGYHQILLPGVTDSQRIMLENVLSLKGWKKKLLLTDELSSLTVPVHFIWGMKDAFESPETGIEKARVIQNFTFEKIADAGHIPWFDQPEKCASHIIKLLKNNKMILLKNMIAFFFFAFMCLNAYSQSDVGAQQRLPVIDMHMHAFDIPVDLPAGEPAPCLPAPCVRQGHASASSAENFEKTLEQ